jgi:serine/threonine protein kinase
MTPKTRDESFADIILGRSQTDPIAGRYSDLSLISLAGFTSVVFSARDLRTDQIIVLKFLKFWSDPYRTASFKREAEAAAKLLGRANIIQLVGAHDTFNIDLTDPTTGLTIPVVFEFFALELAKETLTAALFGRRRPRGLQRRLELLRDVIRGVNRLHNAGFCHRDLKPDNVLIVSKGVAKIGDLGTCRLHSGVDPIGSNYLLPPGDANYSAPEMFNGGGYQPELYIPGDWFSVGAMLFEAVTGQNLYIAIGLRGPDEIKNVLAIGPDLSEYERRVGAIAGRYPIPSTTDFKSEPWLAPMSDRTHTVVTGLIRDLCHFDYRKRLSNFDSILRRIDVAIKSAKLDSPGWRSRT